MTPEDIPLHFRNYAQERGWDSDKINLEWGYSLHYRTSLGDYMMVKVKGHVGTPDMAVMCDTYRAVTGKSPFRGG